MSVTLQVDGKQIPVHVWKFPAGENGEHVLYDSQTPEQEKQGELATVFKDGLQFNTQTLEQIRQRVNESI